MERISNITPRKDFRAQLSDRGFILNENDHYWQETKAYALTDEEVDTLDDAATEVHQLCVDAIETIIDRNLFHKFGMSDAWAEYVTKSWRRRDPDIYARFDFAYDGTGQPKMLEYNADTPTGLVEASVLQWDWLQHHNYRDQFNSIHEQLVEAWRRAAQRIPSDRVVYFTSDHDSGEDWVTTEYMRDTCSQAGVKTGEINLVDIGWQDGTGFVDLSGKRIEALFKLYPWENLARDEYSPLVLRDREQFFEPAWKMLWSNKALLPVLWELHKGHPNLLESHFNEAAFSEGSFVKKALFGREGSSVTIIDPNDAEVCEGPYGKEGYVYQEYTRLPCFDERYPICGVWVINDTACGLGVREDRTRITRDTSDFVPHFIR